MEKIVKIAGKDVRLKSSAALPLRYNAQFGRDFFADLWAKRGDVNKTTALFNIVWTLAKCADDSIPPVMEWVETFEEFPIFEIFNEVYDLVEKSMGVTKKNAKAAAGK